MRKAKIKRKTKETDIELEINLDGKGKNKIDIPIPFFKHMLELFSFHSKIDVKLKAKGDIEVDLHHLVEDLGIVFGMAIEKSFGKKKGIKRYSSVFLPMDESLVLLALDISGRSYLDFEVKFFKNKAESFDFFLIEDFFRALVNNARITLHIRKEKGKSNHHIAEAIFKGFAYVLKEASKIERKGVSSTKGKL